MGWWQWLLAHFRSGRLPVRLDREDPPAVREDQLAGHDELEEFAGESLCPFCSEFPATVQCRQCKARFCMACCIRDRMGRDESWLDSGNATCRGIYKECPRCH